MFERQYKLISSKEELPLRKLIKRLLEDEHMDEEAPPPMQASLSFKNSD